MVEGVLWEYLKQLVKFEGMRYHLCNRLQSKILQQEYLTIHQGIDET